MMEARRFSVSWLGSLQTYWTVWYGLRKTASRVPSYALSQCSWHPVHIHACLGLDDLADELVRYQCTHEVVLRFVRPHGSRSFFPLYMAEYLRGHRK